MAVLPGFGIVATPAASTPATGLLDAMAAAQKAADAEASRQFWAAKNAASVPQGGGGGTATANTDTNTDTADTEDPYLKAQRLEAERLERLRTMNARAVMTSQMQAYGLGALAGEIESWIQQGYDADAVMALVRTTQAYKDRFPAMAALQAKNRAISESEYIAYEQAMAQYESLFGLPDGMLSGKDSVTKFLTNELSAREVEERAVRASASVYKLPEEYRRTMQNYYGVDSGGLTAYFLDPDMASPLLERQYVSAQIGMEAAQRGIDVGVGTAEDLYKQDVDRAKAAAGFQKVSEMSNLALGRGDVATQQQQIGATFNLDAESKKAVERASKAKTGAFQQGGSYVAGQGGVSGLASSST